MSTTPRATMQRVSTNVGSAQALCSSEFRNPQKNRRDEFNDVHGSQVELERIRREEAVRETRRENHAEITELREALRNVNSNFAHLSHQVEEMRRLRQLEIESPSGLFRDDSTAGRPILHRLHDLEHRQERTQRLVEERHTRLETAVNEAFDRHVEAIIDRVRRECLNSVGQIVEDVVNTALTAKLAEVSAKAEEGVSAAQTVSKRLEAHTRETQDSLQSIRSLIDSEVKTLNERCAFLQRQIDTTRENDSISTIKEMIPDLQKTAKQHTLGLSRLASRVDDVESMVGSRVGDELDHRLADLKLDFSKEIETRISGVDKESRRQYSEITVSVDQLRQDSARLEETIVKIHKEASSLASKVSQTHVDLVTLDTTCKQHNEVMESMETRLNQSAIDADSTKTQVSEVKRTVSDLSRHLEAHAQEQNSLSSATKTRIDSIDDRVTALRTDLSNTNTDLERNLSKVGERIAASDKLNKANMDAVHNDVRDCQGDIAEMKTALDQSEGTHRRALEHLKTDLETRRLAEEELSPIQKSVADLGRKIESTNVQVEELARAQDENQSQMNQKQEQLAGRVRQVDGRVTQMTESMEKQEAGTSELEAKCKQLARELSHLKSTTDQIAMESAANHQQTSDRITELEIALTDSCSKQCRMIEQKLLSLVNELQRVVEQDGARSAAEAEAMRLKINELQGLIDAFSAKTSESIATILTDRDEDRRTGNEAAAAQDDAIDKLKAALQEVQGRMSNTETEIGHLQKGTSVFASDILEYCGRHGPLADEDGEENVGMELVQEATEDGRSLVAFIEVMRTLWQVLGGIHVKLTVLSQLTSQTVVSVRSTEESVLRLDELDELRETLLRHTQQIGVLFQHVGDEPASTASVLGTDENDN